MTPLPVAVDKNAPLPATYQRARTALTECNQVDECKDWADKAQALASYAKQADDDELFLMARRIQGRAVRRVGELLEEFKNPHAGLKNSRGGGTPTTTNGVPMTQRQAAARAGLSKEQEVAARRMPHTPEVVAEPDPQHILPGFEHLRTHYVVEREGERIGVYIYNMTDDELAERATTYRKMGAACYAHGDELDRFREQREQERSASS